MWGRELPKELQRVVYPAEPPQITIKAHIIELISMTAEQLGRSWLSLIGASTVTRPSAGASLPISDNLCLA